MGRCPIERKVVGQLLPRVRAPTAAQRDVGAGRRGARAPRESEPPAEMARRGLRGQPRARPGGPPEAAGTAAAAGAPAASLAGTRPAAGRDESGGAVFPSGATRRRPQRRGSRSARVARRRGHRRRWQNPLAVLPTIPLEVPPTENARTGTMPGAATAAFRGCASGKTRPRPPEPRRRKRATRRATRRVGQRSTAAEDAGREGCVRSGSGHPLSSPGSRGPADGRARREGRGGGLLHRVSVAAAEGRPAGAPRLRRAARRERRGCGGPPGGSAAAGEDGLCAHRRCGAPHVSPPALRRASRQPTRGGSSPALALCSSTRCRMAPRTSLRFSSRLG